MVAVCVFSYVAVYLAAIPYVGAYFQRLNHQSGNPELLTVSFNLHFEYLCSDALISPRSVAKIPFSPVMWGCRLGQAKKQNRQPTFTSGPKS